MSSAKWRPFCLGLNVLIINGMPATGVIWRGHVFTGPCTVYPKKYAHGFCFAVLCCGYTLTDFPISIRLTSLALWQSNDCPSASKATLKNMDEYFMWIHYERLHNHNKAKHNKTVCIFFGIYCKCEVIPVPQICFEDTIWSRHIWASLLAVISCLQAIEGEDTENPFICHIMNLLWLLSDKGRHVRFCWIPSHCGIEGNKRVDQLAEETLDHNIDPLANVHHADLKPLVNSFIQQLFQTKWDVAVHGRDLYLLKPTLGPPKKFQYLTRAEVVVITRLRIGHTKAPKAHILSRGPPTTCHHCGQTLTIDHMLLEYAVLRESRDEYYTADSLNTLFETIPETCIVELLWEAGFFYLIWTVRHSIQSLTWTIPKLKHFFNFMYATSDMNGHISSTTLYLN